jgi:hypothetical protein
MSDLESQLDKNLFLSFTVLNLKLKGEGPKALRNLRIYQILRNIFLTFQFSFLAKQRSANFWPNNWVGKD